VGLTTRNYVLFHTARHVNGVMCWL